MESAKGGGVSVREDFEVGALGFRKVGGDADGFDGQILFGFIIKSHGGGAAGQGG